MNNNKALSFFSNTLLGVLLVFTSLPASATEGGRLFQQHCSRCHQSAARITTAPQQIAGVLKAGTIRQHRFNLDDNTIQQIINYIKQQKS